MSIYRTLSISVFLPFRPLQEPTQTFAPICCSSGRPWEHRLQPRPPPPPPPTLIKKRSHSPPLPLLSPSFALLSPTSPFRLLFNEHSPSLPTKPYLLTPPSLFLAFSRESCRRSVLPLSISSSLHQPMMATLIGLASFVVTTAAALGLQLLPLLPHFSASTPWRAPKPGSLPN